MTIAPDRPTVTEGKLYLAFAKCADCNVTLQVHGYGIEATNDALAAIIASHFDTAHYVGEPVPMDIVGVEVSGAHR